MEPLVISAASLVSALGRGRQANLEALRSARSGLRPWQSADDPLDTWVGRVDGLEQEPVEGPLAAYDCRNNRLARLALLSDDFAAQVAEAAGRYGAHRIGVFIGTSTSGIAETENAYRRRAPSGALPAYPYRETHNTYSVADFTARFLGLTGPALAVATACSSSAKVFAVAQRHMAAGFCDAAVVGGVDSLCLSTLYGFNALELVSNLPCRPWDAARNGINLGEAGGFALLESQGDGVALLGYGESSDGYHMSTPHPDGLGAEQAMRAALARAGLAPDQVDYVNLHGTATRSNDSAEDKAVSRVFGRAQPCSSTKGWTGHTLGAAGITEAIFSQLCIEHGFMPQSLNTETRDPELTAGVLLAPRRGPLHVVMSNSFGFGGSNCSLVFGRRA
jgi:3-oxoacyl-[acyl-carrier-protein] synthase-1